MGFAIEMFFDKSTECAILEYWKSLYDTDLSKVLFELGGRPHITLAVYNDVDVNKLRDKLAIFLEERKALKLRFESVSVFPTDPSVVFLAPGMTDSLRDIHREYHNIMQDFSVNEWEYYLPNKWVPHCAIAMEVPRENVSSVVGHIMSKIYQFDFTIEEVGIVEFRPIRHLETFKLHA